MFCSLFWRPLEHIFRLSFPFLLLPRRGRLCAAAQLRESCARESEPGVPPACITYHESAALGVLRPRVGAWGASRLHHLPWERGFRNPAPPESEPSVPPACITYHESVASSRSAQLACASLSTAAKSEYHNAESKEPRMQDKTWKVIMTFKWEKCIESSN